MKLNDLPFTIETHDPEETFQLAGRFSKLTGPGDVVLLHGPLGAGKTLFVRGLCAGLGLAELWQVDSPTYTIANHYDVGPGVDHLDLYRLSGSDDLDEIGFHDMLESATLKVIEWPERLDDHDLECPVFLVSFKVSGETIRTISVAHRGAAA